ncbi:MAG: acetate--CoA ligase family protein [Candidatus Omnitrophota bacterium]|nr:acetate--CoA ligase family protein [Candidatus Omnitrophota bacterium]
MNLDPLFSPKSVAVIGASRDEASVGHAVLKNLFLGGFKGKIYPVNPKAREIEGMICHPSLAAIPGPVDLAVVIVKAPLVPEVVDQCGQKGVKGIVVISSGFKETGEEGRLLEEAVKRQARLHNLPLIGPNCLGILNTDPAVRMNATFAKEMPAAGSIAFLSQSGALCTAVLEYAKSEGIGFSKIISMGNKAGLDEVDLLIGLRDDPQTKVILLYLEDLADGRRFIEVAREITGDEKKGKPVLAIKSGRTPEGAKAVSSHTGSLAGSDEVYDALFAQAGVMRVDSVEELFATARAFSEQPLPAGRRVAIVTNAGGPGIMATDSCIRQGLTLPALEAGTVAKLKTALPPTASTRNPVDLVGDAREDRYAASLGAVLEDPNVDSLIALATPQAMTDLEAIARVIGQAAKGTRKPVLACFMGVTDVSNGSRILREERVPHYRFPEAAVRALARMSQYREWLERPRTMVKRFRVDEAAAKVLIRKARLEGRVWLDQAESLAMMEAYGLPVPPFAIARSPEEVRRAAEKTGFPLAMKILSPDVLHKVDVGGVRLGIPDTAAAEKTFSEILDTVRLRQPDARLDGVLIQKMVPPGTEMILGLKRDRQFGPLLLFGLGGIYVEVFKDVTFRLAPVRELGAERMVKSLRSFRILQGFRGQPPADLPKLIECIERVSQLAVDLEEIEELDINPLIAYAEGKGAAAADVRILLRKE